jgi:hypothetical protein
MLAHLLFQPPAIPARCSGQCLPAPDVRGVLRWRAKHVEQPVMACGGRGLVFLGVWQATMKHRCGSAVLIEINAGPE